MMRDFLADAMRRALAKQEKMVQIQMLNSDIPCDLGYIK